MAYGTYTSFDTLLKADNATVASYGEDNAFQAISDALDAHNALMRENMANFVEMTTDRQRRYGGPDSMAMEEIDEFGTPDAQKISAGVTVGFPLRFYGIGLQWTRLFFQNARASELAAQVIAMQTADVRTVHRELKRAIFTPTNSTFSDRLVDRVDIPVKALINADSSAMPIAPDGSTFDGSTHTHYLGTASFAAADLTSLINTVAEHFLGGQIMLMINRAQETAVRGFTGFTAYLDARLIPANNAVAARGTLDPTNLTNRAIGIFGPAEVWVKPWIPSGYVVAMHVGGSAPALVMRTRNAGSGNLELLFDNEQYPLRSRAMGREFGFGVYNRVAAAVLDTANASYLSPTIAA